nr:4951_t:CDS:2 [Entrophospora candida]
MEEVLISQDYLDHLQREDDYSTSTTLQRRCIIEVEDNNANIEETTKSQSKQSNGRPLAGVWKFFDYDKKESKNGHRWATCFKCNMHWSQGRPVELEEHIALYCTTQEKEIIQFYSQIVAKRRGKGSQAVSSNVIQGIEPTKKKRKHNPGVLSTLAIKLFSVHPHSASCEHIWSCCGWFQGERRTQLTSSHLESMVKINSFLISNAKQELQYYGVDLTEEELLGVFQEAALVAETNDDLEEFVDLPDDSNIEYEDQQLLLDDLMDLTNPEFGNEDKDSNSEENDENDDNDTDSNNEDNEFDEDEFGAAFVQSLQNE